MENASKALIIAGAILVSILLISVGIIIMNAINEPVQQGANSAASQAIEIFNSKLTSYAGNQKGTTVRQLISTVRSINGSNDKKVSINAEGDKKGTNSIGISLGAIDTTEEYNIDMEFDEQGYINNLVVTGPGIGE